MKKVFSIVALTMALSFVTAGQSQAKNFDLIVAPARFSVLQVMFDVIARRPAVLVSYQGEAGTAEPLLHVWSGTAWNPISLHDLRELSFVQQTPTRAILIGGDDLLPVSVRDGLAWMPEVVYIRDLGNANLLNEMGRLMKWSKKEWNWFSARYNLNLEDEAAALRSSSWYDRRGPMKKDDTSYSPVPVTTTREPLSPPSTLPSIDEVERPSDVPVVSESGENLDTLVESLDPAAPGKAVEAAKDEIPSN
jgi:hypothetical protein